MTLGGFDSGFAPRAISVAKVPSRGSGLRRSSRLRLGREELSDRVTRLLESLSGKPRACYCMQWLGAAGPITMMLSQGGRRAMNAKEVLG